MTRITNRELWNADRLWGGDGIGMGAKTPRARVVRGLREHPTEWHEQCAVISWWGIQCRGWGYDYRQLLAIPNGHSFAGVSKARQIQGARMKSAGLRAGAPDLILAVPRGAEGALWLEMKAMDGRVAQEQDDYHALLRRHYRVAVCRGAQAAIRVITEYLGK